MKEYHFIFEYLPRFVNKTTIHTTGRKPVLLKLPFKQDGTEHFIRQKLFDKTGSTYITTELRIIFIGNTMIIQRLENKLPRLITFMCIYQREYSITLDNIVHPDYHMRLINPSPVSS